MIDISATGMGFIDVLASCDAVLTKPGYGTYAEAVCNGVPILTLARPDWPETRYLNAWARRHGRLVEITAGQFAAGCLVESLEMLWKDNLKQAVEASGVGQAVTAVTACLAH